ncbi:hypothetical protein [Flagellimonas pacifica]|uniref:DUF4488 domain-containing protein n=1 Tax=Flagellimonas pacifica TaxID=1247520 RepID=A0A285MZK7_9FLAO|nr:hypothetical protein [Allomuricauda parva]SNZ00921.1 hypothetical protein SAMN06265377_2749 [Allomuricauda parva]
MKNSTLVFRSLGIIIFLTGLAHLFSFGVSAGGDFPTSVTETDQETIQHPEATKPAENLDSNTQSGKETDYIIDKWKVVYNTDEYKGAIVYAIKKEGTVFNAYTYQYEDENGYTEKAEGTKILTITSFNASKGKGIYSVAFEGEKYKIDCKIALVDENTFTLSYDYYGYTDVETWKRQ